MTLDDFGKRLFVVPRRLDVLFGRGLKTAQHTGNLRAVHLVVMYRPSYEAADKCGKTALAERIVSIIHESGGRFLKRERDLWAEVDNIMAREKISHFFRKMRSTAPLTLDSNKAPSESVALVTSLSPKIPGNDNFTASLIHLEET